MYSKSKIKNSYYDLKEIFRDIKEKNYKNKHKETERFEDVPKELSDKDKEGTFKFSSYMDYYLGVKFHQDKKEEVQPSGMRANNKNYNYADAKFVESLD